MIRPDRTWKDKPAILAAIVLFVISIYLISQLKQPDPEPTIGPSPVVRPAKPPKKCRRCHRRHDIPAPGCPFS